MPKVDYSECYTIGRQKSTELRKKAIIKHFKRSDKPLLCKSKDERIKKLSVSFGHYIDPKNSTFDPVFKKYIEKNYPERMKNYPVYYRKKQIIKIIKSGDKFPFVKSKSSKIRKLSYCFQIYINKNHRYHDQEFLKVIEELKPECLSVKNRINKRKQDIIDIVKSNSNLSPEDIKYIMTVGRPKNNTFDQEFIDVINELDPCIIDKDKRALRDFERFFLKNYRFPKTLKSKYKGEDNEHEGYLYYWFRRCNRATRGIYGKNYTVDVEEMNQMVKETCLPDNLFEISLMHFNRFFKYFKRLEDFCEEKQRLPSVYGSSYEEMFLHGWIKSRQRSSKFEQWIKVCEPIVKNSIVPNNWFENHDEPLT